MSTTDDLASLLHDTLLLPESAILYHLSEKLHEDLRHRALVEGPFHALHLEPFARAGFCSLQQRELPYGEREWHWTGKDRLGWRPLNLWYEVDWQGEHLDVITIQAGDRS